MPSPHFMNLSSIVDTVNILNLDKELSNPSANTQILLSSNSGIDKSHYIISDADAELLLLIKFKSTVTLKSIKLYASIDTLDEESDDEQQISLPKQVYIYKLNHLNINFDDIESLNPDMSIKCTIKKLAKGQNINLQKDSKLTLKFKSIQYLAIFIKTNQDNYDKTLINNIALIGNYDEIKTDDSKHDISSILPSRNISRANDPCHPSTCKAIQRIISGLIRYQQINQLSSPIYTFTDYLKTEYKNYFDDLHHFHIRHEHDLEEIEDLLTQNPEFKLCVVDNCIAASRHCREIQQDRDVENSSNPLYEVHEQIWDSVHFHFRHLFEIGLRNRTRDQDNVNEVKYDEDDKWKLTDFQMNRSWNRIKQNRLKYDSFYGR